VRTRFNNKWQKTRGNVDVRKIVKIVGQFPLLHAYGVGFAEFRNIPEATRSKCIDYARYMLAFELDDEIDAAYAFLKAVGISQAGREQHYVRTEYLLELYSYWRKGTEKYPKYLPTGVFGVAAFLLKANIRIVEELKPHFLVPVSIEKRAKVEKFLEATCGFKRWEDCEMRWQFDVNNG
jgi:hypothetical protein